MNSLVRLVLVTCLLLPLRAAAQTPSGKPEQTAQPPRRGAGPTTWRNLGTSAAPARPAAPPMSKQDKQAYENCPNPRRFGYKPRPGKLVRIW